MDITNLSPYVRVAKDSLIPANIHLRKRVIFDYELVYLKSGEIILTVEDKTYHCIPGDIIFLQPRTTHSVKNLSGKPVHQPHVHFDLCHEENSPEVKVSFRPLPRIQPDEMHLFRPILNIEGIGEPPAVLRLQDPRSFEHKLFALIREFNSQMPYRDIAVKGLFINLWTYYLRELYLSQNENERITMLTFRQVKDYMDAHLDQNLTLDELAEYVHLSKYYIVHLFKEIYGMSPIQYHRFHRIKKAKELIQFSDMSIQQVSEQVGYSTVGSFSRAFKSIEKVPPTYYR